MPSRKPVLQISATRPSIMTLVSRTLHDFLMLVSLKNPPKDDRSRYSPLLAPETSHQDEDEELNESLCPGIDGTHPPDDHADQTRADNTQDGSQSPTQQGFQGELADANFHQEYDKSQYGAK